MKKTITLAHGSGGKLAHKLIHDVFMNYFENDILLKQTDSAILPGIEGKQLALTTDAYVVQPIFFPGGDIGKLAVCGTINDLAVSGAEPLYLTASFVLEEGLHVDDLIRIVQSMAAEAHKAGVKIVAGDTKVVNHGQCDKLYITTTGLGTLKPEFVTISTGEEIKSGDAILINGPIANHGMAIISSREGLTVNGSIQSDCASLNDFIQSLLETGIHIKFMRDATRGGVATILAETVQMTGLGIEINEDHIPIAEPTLGLCELLGFDPLYVANEGKVIIIVPEEEKEKALLLMQNHPDGSLSSIIGEVTTDHPGTLVLNTAIGGQTVLGMLSGEQLPRIC